MTGPFAKAHTLTILMAMVGMSISCGSDVVWQVIVRGASSLDRRARLRGTFTAWFFYIHRRAGGWSALSTYTREGGDRGVIATLANCRGTYIQTSEHTEQGFYGNPQPFLKRMGVPGCEFSGAAQPNARHAADAQISSSFIFKGACAPLMPGVGRFRVVLLNKR